MKRTAWRVLSLALCLALPSLVALAQTAASSKTTPKKAATKTTNPAAESAKPEWHSITVVRVKPEKVTDWQDLQKNVVNPALKKSGLKERGVFETAVFGESFEYVIIQTIQSFSQYDEPMSRLRKALGEEAYRDYVTKLRPCIVSMHTYGAQSRPDLSYLGKVATMTGPPKLAVVNSISVAPGRAAAFESFIKAEILPVMKKADVIGYFINQTVYGGDANEYTTVLFEDSFADIGKGSPLVRVLGQAGMEKLGLKYAAFVTRQERMIARFNADLSFFVAP